MNRLQLATLLSWTGEAGIQGRKRLQKVVYFLQQAGCSLDCRYTLHHFGPYSRDVADICDEMVAAGLIDESGEPEPYSGYMQYAYKLKPQTVVLLEKTPETSMRSFRELGERLIGENLWPLELGSTILFFFQQSNDWSCAMRKACEFKNVSVDDSQSIAALTLAKSHIREPLISVD